MTYGKRNPAALGLGNPSGWATPSIVAEIMAHAGRQLAAFLVSDAAAYISGSEHVIDGGHNRVL